jgi:predicted transposase/invertase (TIGR01784 family)
LLHSKKEFNICHKVHSSQQSTKSDYSDIYPVSTLIICDFNIFPPEVPCISHHLMTEKETQKILLNETRYTFVELPKFEHKKDEILIPKDQWVFMLKNYREGPPKDPEKSIIEAFEILAMGKWTKEEINEYEKQFKENKEFQSKIEIAKEEGIKIGKEKGKMEMAIDMIKHDMKPRDVFKISGLSKEKVKEFYMEHSKLPKEKIEELFEKIK